ncbi:hypothetical protein G4B88_025934 [Cannabis sativa]|uniref:SAUR-like auxin-responsive protein family n=1 Tax=Cannabis sativa TaxID=3483 RepID=A0A7J6HFZ0_CANSA|nr:hypothetical protein G4B88_025934 [Cannabis sativa]
MAKVFKENFEQLMCKLKLGHNKKNNAHGKLGHNKKNKARGKFVSIFIGDEQKRYVVPIKLLSSKFFEEQFNEIKEAISICSVDDEPITVPCSTHMFESILHFLQSQEIIVTATAAITDVDGLLLGLGHTFRVGNDMAQNDVKAFSSIN